MAYQVLSLKWRPSKFKDVVGQDHVTNALSNAIKMNRVAHAFTFSGPRGVGKTTTARILSKELNQVNDINESFDIIEMDGASNRGIDEIRNLNDNVNYAPAHGKYKIYIIDEVHMLTKEAFNALLKTLEEPPEYTVFILCTTELHKMPSTILSRTQRFDFKRISEEDIKKQLINILNEEKIKFDEECLEMISERAEGSMRDALSILDQMICLSNNNLSLEILKKAFGVVDDKLFFNLLDLIGLRDGSEMLKLLNQILSAGISLDDFINGFNKFLRRNYFDIIKNKQFEELDLIRIIDLSLKFQSSIRHITQPKIALEILMLKLAYIDKTIDISRIIKSTDSSQYKKKIVNKEDTKNNLDVSENKTNYLQEKNETKIKKNTEKIRVESKSELSLDDITKQWTKVLKMIGSENSKTENFLSDIYFESFINNTLILKVNNVGEFIFKGLLKDKDLIESSLHAVFKSKINLELQEGKFNVTEKKNNEKEKDHPLFMDILNKFEGEILR